MQKRILILFVMLTCVLMANSQVRGRVIDSVGAALMGVNCVLLNVEDSAIVAGVTSDADGSFSLNAKDNKNYILELSFVGFRKWSRNCTSGNLGNIILSEDSLSLDEVVVTPQVLRTFANRDELTLNETAKKAGNNALEAIGSLPQFKVNASDASLATMDNKTILVLIDGMRRSPRDLTMLKPSDIRSIEYYSNPPARYAHEDIGAVIDVRTKRRSEKWYSLYVDTKNGLTTGYGTNLLSAVYMDSLNMFSAAYLIDYRSLNDNRMNNSYIYPEKRNEYRGLPSSYNGSYHIGQLTYQRGAESSVFNGKLEFSKSPGKHNYEQELLGSDGAISNRNLKSDYNSLSLDLYYMKAWDESRSLSLNVLNTYYDSESDNVFSGEYSFENRVDNESYSLIAEALYSNLLWGGEFNFGAYYQYKGLDQDYNSSVKSEIVSQRGYVYADYSGAVRGFSYNVGLGFEDDHYSTANDGDFNYFVFRPSLTLNLQCAKHSAFRLTAAVRSNVPNIGDLTSSAVAIDEHFYSEGNTALRPYYFYSAELSYQFASNNGRFYAAPSVSYNYYPRKNMPILRTEADDYVLRIEGVRDVHVFAGSMSFNYKPLNWMMLQPFYNYEQSIYTTPNESVNHDVHNGGVRLQLVPKNWQVVWNWNFPMTLVDGDVYTKNNFDMNGSVAYNFGAVSVGLDYIFTTDTDRNYGSMNGFSFSEETEWNNFKNLVSIRFSCYLTKGKSTDHAAKRIENRDNDSGLVNRNTAK